MTMILIREGNMYRPEIEMDPVDMPEKVRAEPLDEVEFPTKVEIWGAGLNPDLAAKLLELSDTLETHGEKK